MIGADPFQEGRAEAAAIVCPNRDYTPVHLVQVKLGAGSAAEG